MFKYTYTAKPNNPNLKASSILTTNSQVTQIADKVQNHEISATNLRKNIVNLLGCIASVFHFKVSKFLSDNFSKTKGYYIMKKHSKGLKSKSAIFPWAWDNTNFRDIANVIFSEVNHIHTFSDIEVMRCSYVNFVGATHHSPKLTKNAYQLHMKKLEYRVNHFTRKLFPYCENYRKDLKSLWSPFHPKFYFFSATIIRFFLKSTHWDRPSMTLETVTRHGKPVTTHCHVFGNDLVNIVSNHFHVGDKISFYAQVQRYVKGASNSNDYYLDFTLTNLKDIHSATKYQYPLIPNDRGKLLKMIGKSLATSQLRFIVSEYINHTKNGMKALQFEINPVQRRLNHLQILKNILHKQQCNLLNPNSYTNNQSTSDKSVKPAPSKIATANKSSKSTKSVASKQTNTQSNPVKLFYLNSKNARVRNVMAVSLLWRKKLTTKIRKQYHISINKVRGLSKRMTNYAQRSNFKYRISTNGRFMSTYSLVNSLYRSYYKSIKDAFNTYNNSNNNLTIRQVEDKFNLSHGMIYKARKKIANHHLQLNKEATTKA